jgi:hypothetical protein
MAFELVEEPPASTIEKNQAPALTASTERGMLPWPVMTITSIPDPAA